MVSFAVISQYEITEHLVSIVGADHVRTEASGAVSSAPASTEQVSGILAFCNENGLTVQPYGGSTKLSWGNRTTANVNVSLRRVNRVVEHPWQDLTCTVEAGCNWALLQDRLRAHGQFVAFDPLFADRATVGGTLATNDSGALRHRYGSLRDLVIGMTCVLADGTIARTGGKVVKNVAGYDLCKLFTGSLGTLAIITQANFRLHSLPQYERNFTVMATEAKRLSALLAKIRESHLLVSSLQLRRSQEGSHLDLLLTGHPLAQQEPILNNMVREEGLTLLEGSCEMWQAREALFTPASTILRIGTLPTQVCAYADHLQTTFPRASISSVSQSLGLHTVAIQAEPQETINMLKQLREDALLSRATITVLEPGTLPSASSVIPEAELTLMKEIKHQFDPNNVLNPGKMF